MKSLKIFKSYNVIYFSGLTGDKMSKLKEVLKIFARNKTPKYEIFEDLI